MAVELDYWKSQLDGASYTVKIPLCLEAKQSQTCERASCSHPLPAPLMSSLRDLSVQEGVPPFTILAISFHVLLHRYSAQDDIVMQIPILGEQGNGHSRAPANKLFLRAHYSPKQSFVESLRRLSGLISEAVVHCEAPFDEVVELFSDENHNETGAVSVTFALQGAALVVDADTKVLSRMEGEREDVSEADLSFSLTQDSGAMQVELRYDSKLLGNDTMKRMLGHYELLLERALLNPDTAVGELPLLTEAERNQAIVEWNDTKRDYPRDACIHTLFETQTAQTPDAVAASFEGEHLTYDNLNKRANQLAHHLIKLGTGPGMMVGIGVERAPIMLVGLLAILKAGGAYVPLDPNYPDERLSFMIDDADVDILLTQDSLRERFSQLDAKPVCLDTDSELFGSQSTANLESDATGETLAYVMYTSGSTGKPKGVCVPHRAVLRLVANTDYVQIESNDIVAQASNSAFDAATFEIWGALLHGARLAIFSKDDTLAPQSFQQVVEDNKISVMFMTTALVNQFAQAAPAAFSTMRCLLFGGEQVDPRSIRTILKEGPPERLLHVYGPTETTTFATWFEVTEVAADAWTIPIGRPIANTQLFVLDTHRQPVPVGMPGELYIGGDGVAQGYLNRPELSAERFVENPFSAEEDARLYKTGDSVRWLPTGDIEFLGRLDDQIKLRGFRIELGEIESVLLQQDDIQEAVVILRDAGRNDKRLASYVVARDVAPLQEALKDVLLQKLPAYMVPPDIVFLESLPLTPNGKIDRRALPAPLYERSASSEADSVALSPVEEKVAAIWKELLHTDDVRGEDHFLDLGGHSLLATQVASHIRDEFAAELPLKLVLGNPTLAELAQAIESHDPKEATANFSPLRPFPREGKIPLSYSQERVCFIQELNPDTVAYHFQLVVRLRGKLDIEALMQSLTEVVRRHEIFRTSFHSVDGEAYQQVHPPHPVQLPFVSLSHLSGDELETEFHQTVVEEACKPYNLAELPLCRWFLVRVSSEECALLHMEHHAIHDGWSFNVWLAEVLQLYKGFMEGHPVELPELPIQFADFAMWQREWMQSDFVEKQLDYWKQKLAGSSLELEIPLDHPRPAVQSFQGSAHVAAIPIELCRAMHKLCRSENCTLFMTMLSAFAVVMSRYANKTDINIGTGIANRRWRETETMLGMLVNNVVLRIDLSGNPTFKELIKRIRQTTMEGYENQDIPFDKVVKAVQPIRDQSRNPLFQVMFAFHDSPMPAVDLPDIGVTIDPPLNNGSAKFDLNVVVVPDTNRKISNPPAKEDNGVTMLWEFNTALFKRDTVERIFGHYEALLTAVVADPDARISDLPMQSDAECRTILEVWNDTKRDYPRDASIHALFETQAARTPDAVAASFNGEHLTYEDLNKCANQLAHYLLKLGVGPEKIVGISVERSPILLVGLLGILKAGGAYLPLDPDYPDERLSFMIDDAGVDVLLTQESLLEQFSQLEAKTVCLDSDADVFSGESAVNPESHATAESLAYVMYTSGSTGQPKGVAVGHRNVVRLVKNTNYAALGPKEVFLQFAPISFDASTFEIWGSLLNGGRLAIHPRGLPSLGQLGKFIESNRITTAWLTSGLFHQMVDSELDRLHGIRQLLAGGDVLSPAHVRRALDALEDCTIINGYGPTECTTFSCCFSMTDSDQISETVPIGHPISNTYVYIVDEHVNPVPVGVPGELLIGGDGVARGYLNDSELTEEKFFPDPFRDDSSQCLYRTGDICKWREDGSIDFLGRQDFQVKLRGFRIELGEIETALLNEASIRETVVLAREDQPGDKRLVAYIIPEEGSQELDEDLDTRLISELRASLAKRMPYYMRPTAYVILDALPLTPNGKVDRKALPAPEGERVGLVSSFISPRTETERAVASIWSDVLGVYAVGVEDDFFELGGHSLQATRVVSRIRESFGFEAPLRMFFSHPTVAGLAVQIEKLKGTEAPPITAVSRTARPPLSFAQQRLWIVEQLQPDSPAYNIPLALRLHAELDVSALEQAIGALIERHEPLRTTFSTHDDKPFQVIHEFEGVSLDIVSLEHLSGDKRDDELKGMLNDAALRPFNLKTDTPFRHILFKISVEDHLLLLVFHHIASDGWSLGVMFHELSTLYAAFHHGEVSPLKPLEVQYADFAVWQRDQTTGEAIKSQMAYWLEQIQGMQTLDFPTDRLRPATPDYKGAKVCRPLPAALAEKVRMLAREEGATLYMVLLAAFVAVLQRYTAQEDVAIGSPIANRNRRETEELIGFFVNMLVLRIDASENPSFRTLLNRVRETALDAYENQDLPFEQLVEAAAVERDLSRNPLVQIVFALQNASLREEAAQDGLAITPEPIGVITSRMDLEFNVFEENGALEIKVVYSTVLFEADTIERLVGHYEMLLEGAVRNPQTPVGELSLLTDAKRHQIVVEWNDTRSDFPREACVHQIFESVTAKFPKHVAVSFEGGEVLFEELNTRANQLAHHLMKQGVRPDTLVGLSVERTPDMVVGLLAILKAGGAYLPLDPEHPQEALAFMVEDAKVGVVLTEESLVGGFSQIDATTICLDRDRDRFTKENSSNPESPVTAENLAYVIYTSGSTGRPKGVGVLHRNVNRLVLNTNYLTIEPTDVVGQTSNYAFDAATFELWAPLLHGARLVIIPKQVVLLPHDLKAIIEREKISILFLMTALLNQTAQVVPTAFTRLRCLIFGGEAADPHWIREILTNSPPQKILHAYGPTESTTYASIHEVTEVADDARTIPIGRPITNTQLYLMDSQLQLVPVGVPGELYIGGDGIARGYLNRPELTDERFIPDPFCHEPEARLYKTGDLCVQLEDGTIEFIGRLDTQVKIRGHRIELGEIETALLNEASVRETVVLAREDIPGEKRLVAYIVPDNHMQEIDVDAEEQLISKLRIRLAKQLPDYMCPPAYVILNCLPLTVNGKVDRSALPVPDVLRSEAESSAPRSAPEAVLTQVWEQLLDVRPIGVNDNFFDLGGHSLLAVRLFAQIENTLGKSLPISALFQAPTIAQLADLLSQEGATVPYSSLVPIQPNGTRPPMFWVHGITGLTFHFYSLARYMDTDQPAYGLQATEGATSQLEAVAACYLEVIRTVQAKGPYHLGGHCFGGLLAYEMARQLYEQGETVGLLALLESAPPNSGYLRVGRIPFLAYNFLKNLPGWLFTIGRHPVEYLPGIFRILRRIGQKALRKTFPRTVEAQPPVEDRLDMSGFWEGHHEIVKMNTRLLTGYSPQSFPGRVTVFKTRTPSVGHLDPHMGWSRLANGGVNVRSIPGTHRNFIFEPHVRELARELQDCLNQAQETESQS